MSDCLVLMLGLVAMAGPPRAGAPPDPIDRAAIVDRIMAEPAPPRFRVRRFYTFEQVAAEVEIGAVVKQGEDAEGDEEEAPASPQFRMQLDEANCERWLYGNMADNGSRRGWLSYRLEVRIGQLAAGGGLSPAEIEKLRLAGKGDIKRFGDRAAALHARFDEVRPDLTAGQNFLNRDICRAGDEFETGPFGEGSLFAKTSRTIRESRAGGGRDDRGPGERR